MPTAAAPPAQAATLYGHDYLLAPMPDGGRRPGPAAAAGHYRVRGAGADPGAALHREPLPGQPRGLGQAATTSAPTPTPWPLSPPPPQLTTYRAQGPWSASTRAGQLSNVGYAEARYAVASLQRAGFRPPVVWIDVEPRPAQPWPTATAVQQRENRYVVEGLMRGLRDAGYSYGLYSFASGWQAITGSWRLPGVPVWATAGRLDYPTEALDRCRQPASPADASTSRSGTTDVRDYDLTCDPYAFTPLPMPASALSGATADFNGDWNRRAGPGGGHRGDAAVRRNRAGGGLSPGLKIGTGWAGFNALEPPGISAGTGRWTCWPGNRPPGGCGCTGVTAPAVGCPAS